MSTLRIRAGPDMLPANERLAFNQNNNSSSSLSCDTLAPKRTNENSHSTFKQPSSTCENAEPRREAHSSATNLQRIENQLNELLHADYVANKSNDARTQVVRPLTVLSSLIAVPSVKLPPTKQYDSDVTKHDS